MVMLPGDADDECLEPDWTFADDLIAASNFKTFLVGRGVEVPGKVLSGIGDLLSRYDTDVRAYREHVKSEHQPSRFWHRLTRLQPAKLDRS